jgi:endonuclease I
MSKYSIILNTILLFVSYFLNAQPKIENTTLGIPAGYYDNAYTTPGVPKTCATLKTALYNIISTGTTTVSYTPGVWTAYKKTDMHRNDANTADIIWDMYSDNPSGAEPYTFTYSTDQCGNYSGEGVCYNREHSFPQSWFNSASPMVSDIHHLFPTDGYVNGKRGDNPYGQVSAPTWTSQNGSKLGPSSFAGFTGTVFEPINEYKGDIARAMFYMVTRYENLVASWQNNSTADDILDGTSWPALDSWPIQLWYQWHIADPVSQKEMSRNDSIYTIQKNRNPFIDHPEFVGLVWQCTGLVPISLTSFKVSKINNDIEINWSVVDDPNVKSYEVERSTDGLHFNKIGSSNKLNSHQYNYTDSKLPDANKIFYRLKIIYTDGKTDYSKIVDIKTDNSSAVLIYPNPVKDNFTISFVHTPTKINQVIVADFSGRVVINKSLELIQDKTQIDVRHLPVGKYIVSINTDTESIHEAIIITK